jgi:molybdate transport system substrate-binding protein
MKNVVVRAATVKQLTFYTVRGEVDASIIARADVFQNKDALAAVDIDSSWYQPEVVTAAVLKSSPHVDEAGRLLEFLQSDESVNLFKHYGFLPCQ